MGAGGTAVAQKAHTYVAVVHGEQRIHSIMAAGTAEELTERVADYVRENARVQLYASEAERVLGLLAAGAVDPAVRFYFDRVGRKWDREWLHVDVVEASAPAEATVLFMRPDRLALSATG